MAYMQAWAFVHSTSKLIYILLDIFMLTLKSNILIFYFLEFCSLLWETLTGREHLLFYGRLKNLEGSALVQVSILLN